MLAIISSLLGKEELDSVAYEENDLLLEVLDQVIQGDLSVRIHIDKSHSNYLLAEKINIILNNYEKRLKGQISWLISLVHSVRHKTKRKIAIVSWNLSIMKV